MITIASSKAQRIFNILDVLIDNYGFVSYESIQEFNACSINTAYSDAKYIFDNWHSLLELKLVDKGMITLSKSDSDFEFVRKEILREEFAFDLIWKIYEHGNLSTAAYIKMLACSESHFRKTIKDINTRWDGKNQLIQYDPLLKVWKYEPLCPNYAAHMLAHISNFKGVMLEPLPEDIGAIFAQSLDVEAIACPALLENEYQRFNTLLINYLEKRSDEPKAIYRQLCDDVKAISKSYSEFSAWIEANFFDVFANVEFKNSAYPSSLESLTHYLYYLHIRDGFLKSWNAYRAKRFIHTSKRLYNDNRSMFESVHRFLTMMDQQLDTNLSESLNEIALWMHINLEIKNSLLIKKVGLISDLGAQHTQFLADYLNSQFNHIECVFLEPDNCDKSDIDLVFSNSKKLILDQGLEDIPYLVLSDILTHEERSTIQSAMLGIKSHRKVYTR